MTGKTDGTPVEAEICPRGYYCELNSAEPVPCPAGTYNPDQEKKVVDDCQLSPVNHYQDLIG